MTLSDTKKLTKGQAMQPTAVIYHKADFDGLFCREIARKFLPEAELIGWDFGDPPLDEKLLDGRRLYIMDLPVDRPFGLQFKDGWWCRGNEQLQPLDRWDGSSVIWIDHHKSSIDSHPPTIPGYRIDGVAACRLAWQWFQNFKDWDGGQEGPCFPTREEFVTRKVTEPLSVRLAGEYDVWDKRDDRAEIFQFGLRSRHLTDFDWANMLSTEKPSTEEIERLVDVGHQNILEPDGTAVPAVVCQLLDSGKILQTYQQRNDAGMMHRSFLIEWEGLKFLALTTARCNSLTFASKDVPETGHDALMGFYFNGSKWTVSLYGAKHRTDLDLAKIAVKYGGGGHKQACGFTCDQLPFGTASQK